MKKKLVKDQNNQYFIDLEKKSNSGHVYYLDSSGNLAHPSRDLKNFFDNFVQKYQK